MNNAPLESRAIMTIMENADPLVSCSRKIYTLFNRNNFSLFSTTMHYFVLAVARIVSDLTWDIFAIICSEVKQKFNRTALPIHVSKTTLRTFVTPFGISCTFEDRSFFVFKKTKQKQKNPE